MCGDVRRTEIGTCPKQIARRRFERTKAGWKSPIKSSERQQLRAFSEKKLSAVRGALLVLSLFGPGLSLPAPLRNIQLDATIFDFLFHLLDFTESPEII